MRVEVLGAERRRRWGDEEKRQIVEESLDPAVTVSGIARRHGISRSLLVSWRRQVLKQAPKTDEVRLLPVEVASDHLASDQDHAGADCPAASTCRTGLIEIELTGGRLVRVDREVDPGALRRVLQVLEALR
jgi:transposase